MKVIPIIMLAGALALVSCSENSLQEALENAAETHRPLLGHQDDIMYGHTWNATKDADKALERSDIKAVCGSYPAVLGLDLGGLEIDSPCNLDGNDFSLMRLAAQKHYARGGVVTLSWHLRNPLTGGDAWDISSNEVVASILPGGEKHEFFLGWLDKVCDFIASIKDDKGRQIPLIWRPWHEHTGGWFWWGATLCSSEEFNALWKMTYDYMTEEKGLEGLLWAISPNSLENDFDSWTLRYPGDEYVDIVGLDCYCSTYVPQEEAIPNFGSDMARCLSSLQKFAGEHGKILAVTETGYEGLTYENWWTEVLSPAIKDFPVAYVLVWRNTDERPLGIKHFYAPWPGSPSEEDFCKCIENGTLKLLD